MGKRGTKPFPKIHHELNGNPGKRELADDPVVFGELAPPEWLEGAAMEKWLELAPRIAQTFGGASLDSDALTIYCESWATYLKYKESPASIPGAMGGMVANPDARERNNCIGHLRKYGAVLGLSPSDRVGMPSANQSNSDVAGEFIA